MTLIHVIIFFVSFVMAVGATALVRLFALKKNIIDNPSVHSKKIHTNPTPLLGGIAVFIGFCIGCAVLFFSQPSAFSQETIIPLIGFIVGGGVLMIGGFLDDVYTLRVRYQLLFQCLAIFIVIGSGILPDVLTNPLGGSITISSLGYVPHLIAFVWLLGLMNSTKVLDGMDGLVSGLTAIAAFFVFIVSLLWDQATTPTSSLLLALMGSYLGFLVWNWHPARIFLGESGSVFAGFALGVLSIMSGSKIAATALIMSIPLIDVVRIMFCRKFLAHTSVFNEGDRRHIHHVLLGSGFGYVRSVVFLYACSIVFGIISILADTKWKLVLFVVAGLCIFFGPLYLMSRSKNSQIGIEKST